MRTETFRYSIHQEQRGRLAVISEDDLAQIDALQNQWDTTLGIKKRASGEFENYNPVLARWGYERLETNEQKQLFRINEIQNVTTALRERNHTSESRLTLSIGKDKKIHNEVFPDSSYEQVLERGRRYRAENGSNETMREEAEITGFLKIQDSLASDKTSIGTKYFVISPPGLVEDTPYVHNFVDSYELVENERGERAVQYTRFASPLSYDNYKDIANKLDPEYFDEQDGPIDAWYLANPIQVSADSGYKNADEAFAAFFAKDVKAMEEEQFQELYKIYLPYILYYLDQLTKGDLDPASIAKAYNTLLNSTEDEEMQEESREKTIFVASDSSNLDISVNQQVRSIVEKYGNRDVKEVKAGCGRSGGISFGGGASDGASSSIFTANSVSQFGTDKYGERSFKCPDCNETNIRPEGELLMSCQHCGSKKVSCDDSKENKSDENPGKKQGGKVIEFRNEEKQEKTAA
jgi:DNA-directed RNA polymerase subunit RPC12/RpoP